MSLSLEVRNLAAVHVHNLSQILAIEDEWKKVMGAIKKTGQDTERFTAEEIELVCRASSASRRPAFEVFLLEWGTMGKQRPTVKTLLRICIQIKAVRATSYISEKILLRDPVLDSEALGRLSEEVFGAEPAANEDYSQSEIRLEEDLLSLAAEEDNSDWFHMPVKHENAFDVPRIPLNYLAQITQDWSPDRLIGTGGFADVFRGVTSRSKIQVAVKKLKETVDDPERMQLQFNYEVGELSQLKHRFIIEIVGYSNDSGRACLVYPFMENGNLEHYLHRSDSILTVQQRIKIIMGIADALLFLHSKQKPLIHRDIKTSNILLDNELLPKIADFGLLRHASQCDTETVNIKGTPHYMAPEAMRGDISVKVDVFSFGAVLLELITGLKPIDDKRESRDIITFIQDELDEGDSENEVMEKLLDSRVTWNPDVGIKLFKLAMQCLAEKGKRPHMKEVTEILKSADI